MSIPKYGLHLTVFTNPRLRACTNGPTATLDTLTLVGYIDRRNGRDSHLVVATPKIGPLRATEERPAVVLVVRHIGGPVLNLEPVTWDDDEDRWVHKGWYAAGGSFATGDSRVPELVQRLTGGRFYGALSVHDRKEW